MPEIACLRRKYSAFEKKECKEKGSFAKLKLSNCQNKIALKSDEMENSKKMCDFFVFTKDSQLILVILELKEKSVGCNYVYEKLSNGAILANSIFDECCNSIKNFDFYPILLHHGARSPTEIKMLRTKAIFFKGKKYFIICEEGICELSEIRKKY